MSAFLFCTTPLATLEVIHEFFQITRASYNSIMGPDVAVWADSFILARRDPKQTLSPSKEPLDQVVDLFDDLSESQLRDLFLESYSTIDGKLPQETFAVLDERGVREKTVVIHAWYPAVEDDEIDTWRSWRVRFEDAEEVIIAIIGPLERGRWDFRLSKGLGPPDNWQSSLVVIVAANRNKLLAET